MAADKNVTKTTSLDQELDWWQGQEKKFKTLFSPGALNEKTFMKMKLAHYDQLLHRYQKKGLDREGRLMRKMLRSERRKLESKLYPGLLRKLPRRIGNTAKAARKVVTPGTVPENSGIAPERPQSAKPILPPRQRQAVDIKRKQSTIPWSSLGPHHTPQKSPFEGYKAGSPFPRKTKQKQGLSS